MPSALAFAVGDLLPSLKDDRLDTVPPGFPGGVALVARHTIRAGAGPVDAAAQPEGGRDRVEDGAAGDVAAGQVGPGGQSAAGASEGLSSLRLFRVFPLSGSDGVLVRQAMVEPMPPLACGSSSPLTQAPSSSQRLNRS
ncbi:hypothetical protein ABZ470_07905 [Streptosporangium sp. NPDC020072]|uniref:hypothetical protein n=1 Tax=Streptosporangium sp. NPDC020072 TaxID=3154788 RepID=UPI003427DF8C